MYLHMTDVAHVSGGEFCYMRNSGALLELALTNWTVPNGEMKGFALMTTSDIAGDAASNQERKRRNYTASKTAIYSWR